MRIRHITGVEELIAAEPMIIQAPEQYKGQWRQAVFGRDCPLFLEIGTGMGQFLRRHSRLHPENSYVGMELNATVLYKAVKRCREELLSGDGNLRFIRSNARFLEEYFDPGEVDRIYLNFSDPWPKKHSAGRRLTAPQFLAIYEKILSPDGLIEFKTDNRGLFDYSVETLPACGWEICALSYDLHHDPVMNEGNVMTEYEEKFSAKGNPILKLIARRKQGE